MANEYKLRIASTLSSELEDLIQTVIGLGIEVHRNLGPGYVESIYERAFCYELDKSGISYLRQIEILVPYKDTLLPGQRLDLLVEKILILEIKAIDRISPVHGAQIISYMKSQKIRAGLIINFKVEQLRFGIKRFVL